MIQPAKPDASPQPSPACVDQNRRRSVADSTSSIDGRWAPSIGGLWGRGVSSKFRASLALLAGTLASAPLGASAGDWEGTPWAAYGGGGPVIRREAGPIYRTLDVVAGGIERVFGLHSRGHRCDEPGCDDACDAATLQALTPGHGHPIPPGTPFPHPGFIPTPSDQANGPFREAPSFDPPSTRPPSTRPPRTESLPAPGSGDDESGSFFENLSDPFEDDSAGLRPLRPDVERQESSALRPFAETTAPMGLQPVSVTTPARR